MGHTLCEVARADPAKVSAVASGQNPVINAAHLPDLVSGAETDVTARAGMPAFRCGRCLAKIPRLPTGHTIRCASCSSRLIVPAHVRLRCQRCSRRHQIRPSELNTEHLCAACAQPLTVKDVVLQPARHHHHKRRHARTVRREPHDRAVSTMLLLALTLIAAMMLLMRL
jgi:DNA-directed RNA polymerase subunit RPC12/RpoP